MGLILSFVFVSKKCGWTGRIDVESVYLLMFVALLDSILLCCHIPRSPQEVGGYVVVSIGMMAKAQLVKTYFS